MLEVIKYFDKNKIPKEIIIAAMISLVIIEIAAMIMGYNGTLRMIIVAAIMAMAGVAMPQIKTK